MNVSAFDKLAAIRDTTAKRDCKTGGDEVSALSSSPQFMIHIAFRQFCI